MPHSSPNQSSGRWFSARSLTRTTITNFRMCSQFQKETLHPAAPPPSGPLPGSRDAPAAGLSHAACWPASLTSAAASSLLTEWWAAVWTDHTACLVGSGRTLRWFTFGLLRTRLYASCVCMCVCKLPCGHARPVLLGTCLGVTWLRQRVTVSTVTDRPTLTSTASIAPAPRPCPPESAGVSWNLPF